MERQDTAKLKGIAILMIVLFHFQYTLFNDAFMSSFNLGFLGWSQKVLAYLTIKPEYFWGFFFALGYIGVHIFLILSGYGLTKKYLTQAKGISLRQWGKQIWKLLLPYFIALPLTHIVNWCLQNVRYWTGNIEAVPQFFDIYKLKQYWQSIIFPTRWLTQDLAFNFVGTWWFIGTILQFYIAYPLLLKLLKKYGALKLLLIAIAISIIYRLMLVNLTDEAPIGIYQANALGFISIFARMPEFVLGMYFATRTSWFLFNKQFLVGIILVIVGIAFSSFGWGTIFSDMFIGFGLVLTFARVLNILQGVSGKISQWLGNKAYYIFLYHEPAISMIIRILVSTPL